MLKKSVKEIMEANVISLPLKSPLSKAITLMADNNISFIVIASNENEPLGVITERDILKKAWDKKSDELYMSDVMSSHVFSISGDDDVMTAMHSLVNRNIRHLVVVDNEGEICGVLTLTDFLKKLGFEYFVDFKDIEELMDRSPLTLPADTDAFDALTSLSKSDKSCIIAIEDSRPTGIFTERDALRITQEGRNLSGISLKKLMSIPVVYLQEGSCVFEALSVLNKNKVRHLPVINSNGELSGLISQVDIARGMELKHTAFLKKIIEEQERNLKEANDHLEERIAERTDELTKANERLRQEIEERKLAEEKLRKSEGNIQSIFDNMEDTFYRSDKEGRIIKVSPSAKQLTQYNETELIGTQLSDFYVEHNGREKFLKALDEAGGRIRNYEAMIKQKDGNRIWVSTNAHIYHDDKGNMAGVEGTIRDITERKHAEMVLNKIYEIPEALIMITNKDNIIVRASAGWEVVLGHSNEEFEGALFTIFLHPDDLESTLSKAKEVQDGTHSSNFVNRYRCKDGSYKTLSWFSSVDPSTGFRYGYAKDITESRKAEDELRKLSRTVQQSPASIIIADTEGKIEYVNPKFTEITGYSADEAVGQNPRILKSGEQSPEFYKELWKTITSGKEWRGELYNKKKNGDFFWENASISPVLNEQGEITNFLAVKEDITERKRSENELKLHSQILANLAEVVHLIKIDDLTIAYANPKFYELFGYEPGEILGQHVGSINAPTDVDPREVALKIEADLKVAGTWSGNVLNMKKDGTQFWCHVNISAFDHPRFGKVWLSIQQDITERKRAEESLRLLEKALKTTNMGVTIANTNGRIIYTNPADADMHGYSLEELMGKNIGMFAPEELRKGLTPKQIETAKTKKRESVNIRKDGSTFPVYLISDIVKSTTGEPIGLVTTCEDITERKQAEEALRISDERYSLAIEGSNDGIWERNLVTGETYFSPRWKETIGYRDSEFPNHVNEWKKRVHPDDYDMVINNVDDYLAGTIDRYICEYRIRHKDGSWRWMLAKGAKACDNQGKSTRFAGSHTDITERKKAEEERKSLEAQLLQAQKMETIGTLAGGIAHDFNNILSPILICAEIALDDTPEDSETHETIETILKAAHRAKDLVKRILLFSRSGEQNRETVKIKEAVNDALKLARSSIPSTITISKKIKLKGETITADPIQIHQLVMNLCTNAYQAMQGSGGEINIELSAINIDDNSNKLLRLKEGKYILLSISDTGHGIDESTKQRIFDPFFTTKDTGKGTGLGLSVVLGIVMNHDGEITVESAVDKGTTFHVYLPRSAQDKTVALPSDYKADPKGVENVLFVDDESAIAFVGKSALEHLGYRVTTLNNGSEALEIFRSKPDHFNIVISDYTMPNMTGLQLAIELKEIRQDIPVIITSGYNDTISEENMNRFNIDDYITKPFTGPQLGRAIRNVIDKR